MSRSFLFRKILPLFVCICMIMATFSCQKELSIDSGGSGLPSDVARGNASIAGFVYDEMRLPLAGVNVTEGDKTTTTDQYGMFIVENASVSLNNAKIEMAKPGYFKLVKSKKVNAGAANYIRAQMIQRKLTGTVPSNSGGKIELPGGASVTLPSAAFVNEQTGSPYAGDVRVYMNWIDPEKLEMLDKMPGDLRGISTANTEDQLISYGMITVELEGGNAEKLQIKAGQKAQIQFPLSSALIASSQPTIPLWYYDEQKARWIEEGKATKTGSVFSGEVSHFTTWNADYNLPGPMVNYCVYVVDENKVPYLNATVIIHRPNEISGGHGYTDEKGLLCASVPVNTPLKLDIVGEFVCPQADLSRPIGPFDVNYIQTKTDTIVVRKNPGKTITIKGTAVDCDKKNITDGYIQASINSIGYVGKVTNGTFEVSLLRCPGDQQMTIFGVDKKRGVLSPEKKFHISGLGVVQDVGEIMICGDPAKTRNNALLLHLPFDGDVKDYSGNGMNGTVNGTLSLVNDRRGKANGAYHFIPGNNVTLQKSETVNPYPMTFSVWFRIDEDYTEYSGNILSKYVSGSWNGFYFQVNSYSQNLNPPGWAFMGAYMNSLQNNTSGEYGQRWFNARVEKGRWTHAVYTVDDVGAKYFIDNVMIDAKEWKGVPKPCTANWPWIVGGFKGYLDEMRVYNRVLLPGEIKYLFEN